MKRASGSMWAGLWLAVATLFGGAGMAVVLDQSQTAQAMLTQILSRFNDQKRIPGRTDRDVKIACVNLIFQEWTQAYSDILAGTKLETQDLGILKHFGEAYANSWEDNDILDSQRRGLKAEVARRIAELRAQSTWPAGARSAGLTLTDPRDPLFVENMSHCVDEVFAKSVSDRLPPVDPTGTIPGSEIVHHRYKVTWPGTPAGGISVLVESVRETDDPNPRFVRERAYDYRGLVGMIIRGGN